MAHLRTRLGLHLLVVGYSGNDEEVLRLLKESGNCLRTLTVVMERPDSAALTKARIMDQFSIVGEAAEFAQGFDQFCRTEALDEYFSALAKR